MRWTEVCTPSPPSSPSPLPPSSLLSPLLSSSPSPLPFALTPAARADHILIFFTYPRLHYRPNSPAEFVDISLPAHGPGRESDDGAPASSRWSSRSDDSRHDGGDDAGDAAPNKVLFVKDLDPALTREQVA